MGLSDELPSQFGTGNRESGSDIRLEYYDRTHEDNLWNGFTEEGRENLYTPEELFCCGYAPYFMEGIKLRYPEYCRDLTPPKRNDMER